MKIATVGDNCIDAYEELNVFFPGGNPVNVAVYFSRLGGEASYTGCVGNDKYGEIMINSLLQKDIDISHLKTLEGETAVTKVKLENGERVLGDYNEGVLSEFELTEEDINFLSQHDLVHTGIWGMIEDDLSKIKARDIEISFDFATKLESPIIDKAIEYVDYAFFSYEVDDKYIRDYMKYIYLRGPEYVVVTLGENGSLLYDGNSYHEYGIIPVEVIDTMGAGDSYIAGFLKGILAEKDVISCMKLGAQNAAETLKYNGAW